MPDLQKRFGAAVRAVRVSHGWSQERLAGAAGLDRTYISGIERGRRNPSLSSQERIADALGVKIRELMERAEAMRVRD